MSRNKIYGGPAQPVHIQSTDSDVFDDSALGARSDAPADVVEDATDRSGISLWKGIKNYLRSIKTAVEGILSVKFDQTTPGTTNRVQAGATDVIVQTPTITAGAYTAKDAVGGKLTFAGVGNSGNIETVVIKDNAAISAELVLVLFDQDFTATADNAPFDPSDADMANCLGFIRIIASDYQTFADNGVASLDGVGKAYKLSGAGTSLYGQLMCTGAPTYIATSDLSVKLGVIKD